MTRMMSLSSLFSDQNRTDDFCTSFAHLRRKALQPSTQSFATVNAKLCISQRKALQLPMQSFAGKELASTIDQHAL